ARFLPTSSPWSGACARALERGLSTNSKARTTVGCNWWKVGHGWRGRAINERALSVKGDGTLAMARSLEGVSWLVVKVKEWPRRTCCVCSMGVAGFGLVGGGCWTILAVRFVGG